MSEERVTGTFRRGTTGLAAFLALTGLTVVAVTMLIWLAAAGRSVSVVFPFSAAAWAGYLLSHHIVEGTFVDEGGVEAGDGGDRAPEGVTESLRDTLGELRSSPARAGLTTLGVGGMLLTFPAGILAVGNGDLLLMFVSATLFVGGYVVGHQGVTGKPL